MKTINLTGSVAAAMMLLACNDTEVINPVEPKPGQEVEFSISYRDVNSRTVYGDEVNDGTGHYFPVKWVWSDQVFLMSADCNPSTAQYKVGFDKGTQESAETLVKMGERGLQWSTNPTGTFCSIYPYDKADIATANPAARTVTVRMPHIQNDTIVAGSTAAKPDMNAAFLYAETAGVRNGAPVKLHYYNLATALRFVLQGPADNGKSVMIQEVTLIAPGQQIAGNFELTFPDGSNANVNGVVSERPTFTPGTVDGSNYYDRVILYSRYANNANLTLQSGQSIELNAFFMINEETNLANLTGENAWKLQVKTLDKLYTITISNAVDGKNLILKPGDIHRLGDLPKLPSESTAEWNVENWMTNIPRNTYISEVSVPGSWNSLNSSFQSITGSPSVQNIIDQYNVGARAFHFDTRWKWNRNGNVGSVLIGSVANLGIADGTDAYKVNGGTNDRVMGTGAVDFANALNTLAGQVKTDEYMILMCTFAQASYVNPNKSWYAAISDACNSIANSGKIFDASKHEKSLANTIVNEVLGKLIVIINMEGKISATDLPAGSKCFFVNAPLTLDESMFTNKDSYNRGPLYTYKKQTDVTLYNTQAQISSSATSGFTSSTRGYAPTKTERQAVAQGLLDWSYSNYSKTDYAHNIWIYLGLGGYYQSGRLADATGYNIVASDMNNWINGRVNNMSATPTGTQTSYFPVGIVLMNFVNNATYGQPVVKNILLLNNRYGLKYDGSQPAWPNAPQNTPANYSASHTGGGSAWDVQ